MINIKELVNLYKYYKQSQRLRKQTKTLYFVKTKGKRDSEETRSLG